MMSAKKSCQNISVVKFFNVLSPTDATIVTITAAMSDAIIAYSTPVAPSSVWLPPDSFIGNNKIKFNNFFMEHRAEEIGLIMRKIISSLLSLVFCKPGSSSMNYLVCFLDRCRNSIWFKLILCCIAIAASRYQLS